MIVECSGCKRRYDVSGRPAGSRARCRCGTVFTLPDPPKTPSALNCPQCAANVPIDSSTCQYCSASLAVRACPRCFGMLFLGTTFCPGCGSKVEEPATALPDGSAAPRFCPRCQGGGSIRLESRLMSEVMLDSCPHCDGTFLDSDLLERILAERRYQPGPAPDRGPGYDSRTDPGSDRAKPQGPFYIKCPDCSSSWFDDSSRRAPG